MYSADWSEPGIGKSLIALAKVTILKDLGLVKKILIICPKTVMFTWAIEIEKHTTMTYTLLTGSVYDKIDKLKNHSDIFIITYDSIPGKKTTRGILLRALGLAHFDFLIGDEITMIQNRTAIRTGAIVLLGDLINQKLFLSGTPITNNTPAILTIYRALDGGKTFGRNFFQSRNRYFKDIGSYYPNWVIKETSKEEFTSKLYSIAIRLTKEDCLELPPKVWSSRYTTLSKEQEEYYRPVASDLIKQLDTETGKVNIKSTLDKIGKLSQITSGFMYTEDKKTHFFNQNNKLELLEEVISEFSEEEKIIIYCRWRSEIDLLSKWCNSKELSYVSLSGDTEDRGKVVDMFQNKDTKLLLCNISVGKYSLTLTSSSTILYYSMGFSTEEFIQSSDRIHRISQTKTCLYVPLLIKNGIDEYIYNSVIKKISIANAIINPEFKEMLKRSL